MSRMIIRFLALAIVAVPAIAAAQGRFGSDRSGPANSSAAADHHLAAGAMAASASHSCRVQIRR